MDERKIREAILVVKPSWHVWWRRPSQKWKPTTLVEAAADAACAYSHPGGQRQDEDREVPWNRLPDLEVVSCGDMTIQTSAEGERVYMIVA